MRVYQVFSVLLFCFQLTSCISDKPDESFRPNILFVISDDQSHAHTGFGGSKFLETPAFDKIAREGIYFTNCMSGSPGCAPSRSSLVTGRHHWQNEQSGQHNSSWMKKHVPFVDVLSNSGYATGMTGKGVRPFQYARDENDSLWRSTDAAGIAHSDIRYQPGSPGDERPTSAISDINYFENFKYFMENIKEEKPFFFWYGSHEPHRRYEQDSWKRTDKKIEDAVVPGFLPDNDFIRGDVLDYAVEIEWFDLHLKRMLEYLESVGELENTVVIVTSDNGMPFPRAKTNSYEYGIHVPLAISYPGGFPGGRVVEDPVGFSDFAPTILEIARCSPDGMLPMSGKSILSILNSEKQGIVDKSKQYVFAGRERHGCSRYQNRGYPQRAIRSRDYLFIWNMKPARWPQGAPQAIKPGTEDELLPLFGLDDQGKYQAFRDVANYVTPKIYLIENRQDEKVRPFFDLSFAKRPEFELYNVMDDPYNIQNLYGKPEYSAIRKELFEALKKELKKSGDPRIVGPDKEIFDSYEYFYDCPSQYPATEE